MKIVPYDKKYKNDFIEMNRLWISEMFLLKENSGLSTVGIKKPGICQIIVLLSFVAFSVGGQIIPKLIAGEQLSWHVLPIAIIPLIMTTFFEEFLFRGFVQTRLEKHFGTFTAILVSGLLFSLYHLGYPGFRTVDDILLLFAVGVGFAVSFKLSDNNLLVSYFVNLPNAFVTYILKHEQFPEMTAESSVYASLTIILGCIDTKVKCRFLSRISAQTRRESAGGLSPGKLSRRSMSKIPPKRCTFRLSVNTP